MMYFRNHVQQQVCPADASKRIEEVQWSRCDGIVTCDRQLLRPANSSSRRTKWSSSIRWRHVHVRAGCTSRTAEADRRYVVHHQRGPAGHERRGYGLADLRAHVPQVRRQLRHVERDGLPAARRTQPHHQWACSGAGPHSRPQAGSAAQTASMHWPRACRATCR